MAITEGSVKTTREQGACASPHPEHEPRAEHPSAVAHDSLSAPRAGHLAARWRTIYLGDRAGLPTSLGAVASEHHLPEEAGNMITSEARPRRVLVIDDDPAICRVLHG